MKKVMTLCFLFAIIGILNSAEPVWDWTPTGISGGGAMFSPVISPLDSKKMFIPCDMSGGYVTENGGESWQMIHHSELIPGIRFQGAYHPATPDTLYAASGWDGNVLKVSKDGGKTWKFHAKLPQNLIGGMVIDRDDPKNFALGAGKKVWLSNDGGISWKPLAGVSGTYKCFDFGKDGVYFAATDEGVFCSKDSGKSWSKTSKGLTSGEIMAFAAGVNKEGTKRILYTSVRTKVEEGKLIGGVFRSEDLGESWVLAMGEGINVETKAFDEWSDGSFPVFHYLLAAKGDPQIVYALNSSTGVPPPHHATVYRSENAGKTWKAVFSADPRWEPYNVEKGYVAAVDKQYYGGLANGVAISPNDANTLLWVDNGDAYVTFNGGESWKVAHTRAVPVKKDEEPRWICNGLVVTTAWNYKIDPLNPSRHFICYTDIGLARSEDSGKTWSWWARKGRAPWRNTCYDLAFDPEIPGKIWGAFSEVHDLPFANTIEGRHKSTGKGGICLSTDGGKTWIPYKENGMPVSPATGVVVDPKTQKGKRTLYAGFFGAGVYRSDDDGATWKAKNEGLGGKKNLRVSRILLHADGTLFAVVNLIAKSRVFRDEGAGVYRSTDKGENWSCITEGQGFYWPKDITADAKDSNVLYLGVCNSNKKENGGLYVTKDGGKTWKLATKQGSEHMGVYPHPSRPGWMFLTVTEGAPEHGLYLSRDCGVTFNPVKEFPFLNAMRVVVNPKEEKTIYVTTFGGSVWKGKER